MSAPERTCSNRFTTLPVIWSMLFFLAINLGCEPMEAPVPKDNTGIFGKKTQDVGEFDPEGGEKVSDSEIDKDRLAVPLIGAAAAYGPLVERIAKMGIDRQVEMFRAIEGRYPRDHEEFMKRIIEENQIQLPVLPGGAKYQYDVENHKLVVIEGNGVAEIDSP